VVGCAEWEQLWQWKPEEEEDVGKKKKMSGRSAAELQG
jgi:hypothetical protein